MANNHSRDLKISEPYYKDMLHDEQDKPTSKQRKFLSRLYHILENNGIEFERERPKYRYEYIGAIGRAKKAIESNGIQL